MSRLAEKGVVPEVLGVEAKVPLREDLAVRRRSGAVSFEERVRGRERERRGARGLVNFRGLVLGWLAGLGDRMNHQKLMVPEVLFRT